MNAEHAEHAEHAEISFLEDPEHAEGATLVCVPKGELGGLRALGVPDESSKPRRRENTKWNFKDVTGEILRVVVSSWLRDP
jgi:hypothetical protein